MSKLIPRRPSPAMALAFVALLAALSGTAIALPGKNSVQSNDIKRNAITSPKIKKNAVRSSDIKKGAVRSSDVKNDSLTGADILEGSLGTVPSANVANSAAAAASFGGFGVQRIGPFNLAAGATRAVFSAAPFAITATCTVTATEIEAALVIDTSQDNAMVNADNTDGDFDAADPPLNLIELTLDPAEPGIDHADDAYAIAPNGRQLQFEAYVATHPFGTVNTCRFGGLALVG